MKNQKGITLIALIITIIVMLILVGVSISVALNGGLFKTAKEASKGTEIERDKEQYAADGIIQIGGMYYSIDDYLKQITENNNSRIKLTYTIEPAEDKLSAKITVKARMLAGYRQDYREYNQGYEEWALRQLEGKSDTEIEEMFLNGDNYWQSYYGLPLASSIDELISNIERAENIVLNDISAVANYYGFDSVQELAVAWMTVRPYDYMADWRVWAYSKLKNKSESELMDIFLNGFNLQNRHRHQERSRTLVLYKVGI